MIASLFKRGLITALAASALAGGPIAGQKPSTSAAAAANDMREPVTGMEFVKIPAGSFTMGCSDEDRLCDTDEQPAHKVRISKAFEIGKLEVAQNQWDALMTTNPVSKGPSLPVEQVSWDDVQAFLQKLNAQHSKYKYRLPTEAEWEYAARAGNSERYAGDIDSISWYRQNSGNQAHPGGEKRANAWGVYDMEGNVWEWVQDFYNEYYYAKSPGKDPSGPEIGQIVTVGEYTGPARVLRGGSWTGDVKVVRVSYRSWGSPSGKVLGFGFRCVREPIS